MNKTNNAEVAPAKVAQHPDTITIRFIGQNDPIGTLKATLVAHAGNTEITIVQSVLGRTYPELQNFVSVISAAPELLAALHKIDANAAESPEWIRRTARAAIAKAKGEA